MFFNNSDTRAPKKALHHIHHDLLLNFSQESLFEGTDRTYESVYVELPFPIVNPTADIKHLEDGVSSLLSKKKEYLNLLESKRKHYKHDMKKIEKKKIGNNEVIYLPKHLIEFYQMKDPDPYFQCDYNYYFTGGVLEEVEIEGKSFLIYPNDKNEIVLLDLDNSDINSIEYRTNSPIHNISTSSSLVEKLIVIREKCRVHVLNMDNEQKAVLKWEHEYNGPLMDAKLNSSNLSHMGIVKSSGTISISDIESSQILCHYRPFENSLEERCDKFQYFHFFNNNNICLLDRCSITIIDYRTKSLENKHTIDTVKCNSLCNFKILDNTLLLTSRHYLMKTDMRYLKNELYYSHTLDSPPCYMDLVVKDTDSYLAIGGQKPNSKVLFTGSSPYSAPYKVPCILNSLEDAMLKDPTLILHLEDFRKRLSYQIAGLKILNLNNEICIFTCNSLGEIFKQRVGDREFQNDESAEVLSNWLKEVKIPKPTLHLNLVEEMSGARFTLNKEPKKRNLEKYGNKSKANQFLAKFGPRYYKKNIHNEWAAKFVSAWDDGDETEEEDDLENLPEMLPTDKVEGWIYGHEFSGLEDSF